MRKTCYTIKETNELSLREIRTILTHWDVPEWKNMSSEKFRITFARSEFHLLTDIDSNILCVARINFRFKIEIRQLVYNIAELVGLVSIEKGKGYGKKLMSCIKQNLSKRKIEVIGFCGKEVRPFYKKCGIPVLHDKAKYLVEISGDEKVITTDDDILNLSLGSKNFKILQQLSKTNTGLLLLE